MSKLKHIREFVGTIYICNDDENPEGDTVATVTCRDSREFREIAEGSAITLDDSIRFPEPGVAMIGYAEEWMYHG